MLDFLSCVFLPWVDHHPRKAGMLRHGGESVKRGGMKLESIPLLHQGILSSCCEDEERSGSGMRRVKILMAKEAAARLLSNCTSDGGVLQFKILPQHLTTKPTAAVTTPLPLLSNFKTKYD
ncbi:UNVERIFIED_CONTAM: hypothetical protein Sindi_0862600 [Sesamum indicum]